ncbi:hypothetical protein PMAYCL1PPCAC_25404, partial [Pristionchus mayeri]
EDEPPALTTDIIRRVIAYANHSVGEIRMVRRQWKHLASEEYSKLNNLPAIDELEISQTICQDLNCIAAEVKIRKGFAFAFKDINKFSYNIDKVTDDMITARRILWEVVLSRETRAFSLFKQINRIVLREMNGRTSYFPDIFRGVRSNSICIIEPKMTTAYT